MRDKSSFVYVRTGPRPAGRQGVRRSAPAVRAEVLSWRVRVRMPDGSEREVEQDELETFVDPDSVENNQPESRLEKAGLREQERVTHPSFGTIRVSNSMGYRHLFGSRVDNQHVISMSISAGAVLHATIIDTDSEDPA